MNWKLVLLLYSGLILLAVIQAGYYYPDLPEQVSSHFDASGTPDAFWNKSAYILFQVGMIVLIAIMFIGVHLMITRLPNAFINLPNKEYWLEPQRRNQTVASISSAMWWMGSATVLLLLVVFQLVIHANISGDGTLRSDLFWILFGGYLLFTLIWLAWLVRRFMKLPQ